MKGKYSARAANRAVAVDNDVIADLREKLRTAEVERDQARSELRRTTDDYDARVLRGVAENTALERDALRARASAEQGHVASAMALAAEEVADVLAEVFGRLIEKFGSQEACIPSAVTNRLSGEGPSLIRVFDLLCGDRAGELMEHIMTSGGNNPYKDRRGGQSRDRRRRSAREIDKDMAYFDALRKKKVLAKKTVNLLTKAGDEQEA